MAAPDETTVVRIDNGLPFAGDAGAISEEAQYAASQLIDLAEQVRAGVLRGFAIVLGVPEAGTDLIGSIATVTSLEPAEQPLMFIAGLDRLKHRLHRQMDQDCEEME